MNKMRYKNGKGDSRGFTTILYNERLPCGIIPQYICIGNHHRLHILFHICGINVEHHSVLKCIWKRGHPVVDCGTSIF